MMALGILQFDYLKSQKHLISWLLEKKTLIQMKHNVIKSEEQNEQ
jgi:hypothetical protein